MNIDTEADWVDGGIDAAIKAAPKLLRVAGFALIAALLTLSNGYPVSFPWIVVIAIGVCGFLSSTVKVGQFGLFLLLVLALVPQEFARWVFS